MAHSGPAHFERALARLPQWILMLGVAGTVVSGSFFGLASGGGFLTGSLAAYLNFRAVERVVDRVARQATENRSGGAARWMFAQFGCLVLGGFVILRYSGFNMAAAFCGFLVCPAAVVLEILYELVTHDHS